MNEEEFWLTYKDEIRESIITLKENYPEMHIEDINDALVDVFFHLREEYGVR
jgi:hypothetical protein